MLMSVLLSVRPALSHSGSGRSCSVETSSWSTWRILRRKDHRIRTSTGRHRGGTSGGTLVFTQVRPRPPEKFPNTLDFDGYGRAHRTLSRSGARARALIGGADSSTAGRS